MEYTTRLRDWYAYNHTQRDIEKEFPYYVVIPDYFNKVALSESKIFRQQFAVIKSKGNMLVWRFITRKDYNLFKQIVRNNKIRIIDCYG